ncbi:hypothetical protein ABZ611_27515 [Streptomyces sp. NPDC007861]|uniref:hypothetical protein n=1 Tax=Streptomyces sp. NPDC007861 TaxID=3154893 RepID=UPI0033F013A1
MVGRRFHLRYTIQGVRKLLCATAGPERALPQLVDPRHGAGGGRNRSPCRWPRHGAWISGFSSSQNTSTRSGGSKWRLSHVVDFVDESHREHIALCRSSKRPSDVRPSGAFNSYMPEQSGTREVLDPA